MHLPTTRRLPQNNLAATIANPTLFIANDEFAAFLFSVDDSKAITPIRRKPSFMRLPSSPPRLSLSGGRRQGKELLICSLFARIMGAAT